MVAIRTAGGQVLTDTLTSDSVELLIIKIDETLSEIGNINVETSKMIDVLLDMRLVALSIKG